MFIELFGSSDRLGGNIISMISQIIFAIHNKFYIKYDRNYIRVYNTYNQGYNNSIFMQTLFDIIDYHNNTIKNETFTEYIELAKPSHYEVLSKTVLDIKQDLFSYFKQNIFTENIREYFLNKAKILNYEIPFDPKKTILIHHRLEDVRSRPDYDGSICADYMKDKIENNIIVDHNVLNIEYPPPICQMQAPLSTEKLKNIINIVSEKNSDYEIIIITNPNENLEDLPYKCLSSNDEFYDLFLLCNCENLILSRSNYALSSLFFGIAKNINIPLWGIIPCYGLDTKYDQNNFNFFS